MVAPSANRSGHVSPTSAAHVLADLRGRIDLILDGGPCPVGVESTIVACLDGPTLLRPGGVARERSSACSAVRLPLPASGRRKTPLAPGMLARIMRPRRGCG